MFIISLFVNICQVLAKELIIWSSIRSSLVKATQGAQHSGIHLNPSATGQEHKRPSSERLRVSLDAGRRRTVLATTGHYPVPTPGGGVVSQSILIQKKSVWGRETERGWGLVRSDPGPWTLSASHWNDDWWEKPDDAVQQSKAWNTKCPSALRNDYRFLWHFKCRVEQNSHDSHSPGALGLRWLWQHWRHSMPWGANSCSMYATPLAYMLHNVVPLWIRYTPYTDTPAVIQARYMLKSGVYYAWLYCRRSTVMTPD